MTWKHGLIIILALAAPIICGLSPTCAASMATISDLSKMTIAGVLGNATAGAQLARAAT